jgi:hypothetical protein
MSIFLEPGVMVYDDAQLGRHLEFIGVRDPNHMAYTHFFVGAYGFSNPYSANMFAYLFHRYNGEVAKSTVMLFESDLQKSAVKKFWDFCDISWGDVFKGNVTKVVDWQGIVQDLAIAAGGWAFRQLRMDQALADRNPYSAEQDQEQYVVYAIAWWRSSPTRTPAYKILDYNVH